MGSTPALVADDAERAAAQAMLGDASRHDRPATAALLALVFWVSVRAGGRWSYGRKI